MAANTGLCFECPANLCCQSQRRLQIYKVTDILERPEINRAAESFHDPPPAHPPFGEAMQKENGRSLPGPCCCHMEANAVGSDL